MPKQKKAKGQIVVDFVKTAIDHRDADWACGRPWSCYCAACRPIKDSAPELVQILEQLLIAVKRNPAMNHRDYIPLGIKINAVLSMAKGGPNA